MNLYQIDEQYLHILQELEASEGDLSPALEESLKINEEDFQNKVANYRAMIMKWEDDIEAANRETARVKVFKTNRENAIERLSTTLDQTMKLRNLDKLDMGLRGKISYRKSVAVIVMESLLPKKWFNRKVTETPDKLRIKAALDEGKVIKGAGLETRYNIQIK